jgi:hypothetical protein
MNLIKIRGDNLLSQFVILCRDERRTRTSQQRDQRLKNAVGVCSGVGIVRLNLAERGRDNKQSMWVGTHATESINKHGTLDSQRVDQIVEILPLDNADIFQAASGLRACRTGRPVSCRCPGGRLRSENSGNCVRLRTTEQALSQQFKKALFISVKPSPLPQA